ncbi:hypothetical protein EMPG_16429 [Blastomyces silverae]|uniref:Uncharacterized protein n=1 Tax=Blastomyces silverae TaxID=2060906 RepID=A0A0H1B9S5_9EURO|nr:hypothetical protein EMPG_16429 [Blastomyces silverae]
MSQWYDGIGGRQMFPSVALRLSSVHYECRPPKQSLSSPDRSFCNRDCWLTADGKVWVSAESWAIKGFRARLSEELSYEESPVVPCEGRQLQLNRFSLASARYSLLVTANVPHGKGKWSKGKWYGGQKTLAQAGSGTYEFKRIFENTEESEKFHFTQPSARDSGQMSLNVFLRIQKRVSEKFRFTQPSAQDSGSNEFEHISTDTEESEKSHLTQPSAWGSTETLVLAPPAISLSPTLLPVPGRGNYNIPGKRL